MKTLVSICLFFVCFTSFAQQDNVKFEKVNDNLIQATYYFADNANAIEKIGFFNAENKLHGTWTSYDKTGNITTIANYNNGIKEGVWQYITNDVVNVVTYKNNKVIKVEEKAIVIN